MSTIRDQMVIEVVNCHENFLAEDDIEIQNETYSKLLSYSKEFLSAVSHNDKFGERLTYDILRNSAMNINFEPDGASRAFQSLAKYAHNLILQPWRTDFHTLKLTSGYFVHNVKAYLETPEEIFIAMGYRMEMDRRNNPCLNLDLSQFNNDNLKRIAIDMILGSQECQILSEILRTVSTEEPTYPPSICDVFEFRCKEVGCSESISRSFVADIRKRQKAYQTQVAKRSSLPARQYIDIDECFKGITDALPKSDGQMQNPSQDSQQRKISIPVSIDHLKLRSSIRQEIFSRSPNNIPQPKFPRVEESIEETSFASSCTLSSTEVQKWQNTKPLDKNTNQCQYSNTNKNRYSVSNSNSYGRNNAPVPSHRPSRRASISSCQQGMDCEYRRNVRNYDMSPVRHAGVPMNDSNATSSGGNNIRRLYSVACGSGGVDNNIQNQKLSSDLMNSLSDSNSESLSNQNFPELSAASTSSSSWGSYLHSLFSGSGGNGDGNKTKMSKTSNSSSNGNGNNSEGSRQSAAPLLYSKVKNDSRYNDE